MHPEAESQGEGEKRKPLERARLALESALRAFLDGLHAEKQENAAKGFSAFMHGIIAAVAAGQISCAGAGMQFQQHLLELEKVGVRKSALGDLPAAWSAFLKHARLDRTFLRVVGECRTLLEHLSPREKAAMRTCMLAIEGGDHAESSCAELAVLARDINIDVVPEEFRQHVRELRYLIAQIEHLLPAYDGLPYEDDARMLIVATISYTPHPWGTIGQEDNEQETNAVDLPESEEPEQR